MVNELAPEIIALARELCGFVDTVSEAEQQGLLLSDAHRARVIVNNLRPLIVKYEAAMAAAAGSLAPRPPDVGPVSFTWNVPPNAPGHEEH